MKYTQVLSLLVAGASAQNLTSILTTTPNVDDFRDLLAKFPALNNTLAAAKDITLFVPRNGASGLRALDDAADSDFLNRIAPGSVEARLSYHAAKGVITSATAPNSSFVQTLLTNANYSSVAGGQRVQVVKGFNGRLSVVSGNRERASVLRADIKWDGGVIHVIDSLLEIPGSAISTARSNGQDTLLRGLRQTNTTAAVESAKDVTIFAPRDGSFIKAKSKIESLSVEKQGDALKNHVAQGVQYSTSLRDGQTLSTLSGGSLKVAVVNGTITVNGAKVIRSDILVKQGVLHIVDSALI